MVILDIEVYGNYFLAYFKDTKTGKYKYYEMFPGQPLDIGGVKGVMERNTTIGFNSLSYDLPLIVAALEGWDNEHLKAFSDKIIKSNLPSWSICKTNNIVVPDSWDTIDLIEVAPGIASLKLYGCRMKAPKIQDLPIEAGDSILPEMREEMREYCRNDLDTTEMLYEALRPQIDLRISMSEQYGIDLRSKSDAQIAEAVIKSELEKRTGRKYRSGGIKGDPPFPKIYLDANELANEYLRKGYGHSEAHFKAANDMGVDASELGSVRAKLKLWRTKKTDPNEIVTIRYKDPKIVSFTSPDLQTIFKKLLDHNFELSSKIKMPKWLKDSKIKIGDSTYQMGIGGLHSTEKSQLVEAGDGILCEYDVASYYPSIILEQQLSPKSMGKDFLELYQDIVTRRLKAKAEKDMVTANTLKIVLNGSYGKLGNKYSSLYAPTLLLQVTITGQLCLLMLIESMENAGISIVSANTDGIVCRCTKAQEHDMEAVAFDWELTTSYELERTDYTLLASRDVNSYMAVKPGGKVKRKGIFNAGGLSKNPDHVIIYDAVVAFLAHGTPIEQTINDCNDPGAFVSCRKVTGGCLWNGEYIGKAVRFYVSKDSFFTDPCLHYKLNNNRVPKSGGCRPLMEMGSEVPSDLNRQSYIEEAYKLLEGVGYVRNSD